MVSWHTPKGVFLRQIYSVKSLYRIGSALLEVIKIYPMPLLASLTAFILILVQIHITSLQVPPYQPTLLALTLESIGGMLLFFTADVIARWNKLDLPKRIGLYLLVLSCLGIHYYSIDSVYFDSDVFISRYAVFFVIYFLSIGLATYVNPKQDDRFWKYNFHFLRTLVQSAGFTVVFLLGVISAYWAIDKLFGMNFNDKGYATIVAFVLLLVHSFLFLTFFPKGTNDIEGEFAYPEWLRVLGQYILLPVVIIYGTFLYIYVFKILMEYRMPNGWVSIPILVYSGAGLLAYSLLYPFRNNQENRMVYPFMRYFFYTLLPLLTLYFIAIYLRIKPYGITENRYMLVMLGLWLTGIVLYTVLSKQASLSIVPQSLFVMLILSVIGPWGMYQWSIRSQSTRLRQLLMEGRFLVQNRFDLDKPHPKPNDEQVLAYRSVLNYLKERNQLKQLHPYFDAKHQNWLNEKLEKGRQEEVLSHLYQRMGIYSIDDPSANAALFKSSLAWGSETPLPIQQVGRLIRVNWRLNDFVYDGETRPLFELAWQHDTLVCRQANFPTVYFPIKNALQSFRTLQSIRTEERNKQPSQNLDPFAPIPLNDSLNTITFNGQQLFVDECYVVFNAQSDTLERFQAYWFIPTKTP